jgi:thiol-disulfide isomerase/thioredoxin
MKVRQFRTLFAICCIAASIYGCDDKLGGGLKRGEPAPKLATRTLADVGGDMGKLTTYRQPDERMYQYSMDKALTLGKPIVLEFATPGHCTVCDKQLQVVKALLEKYQNQMIFLHMDQYYNPQAYKAYRVEGDPWTFIIDNKGIVRFQRAGSLLYGELDMAIKDVLKAESVNVASKS